MEAILFPGLRRPGKRSASIGGDICDKNYGYICMYRERGKNLNWLK